MNKHLYRIVFNKARGQLMAVAETVVGAGKTTGTTEARGAGAGLVATLRPLAFCTLVAIGAIASFAPHAQAQIVADPGAPRTQQPTILNAANGVPLVNIQTPSAAGVSRNNYRQFDVNGQGAILNNARTNAQTQLGGWVQGNPWLAAGTARVILNEINSSHPSQLRGYVEVAGDRAQVVIANPAGITCDGCGFLNANRATLTTGTPVVNGGSLDGYRVQSGAVNITGAGLDASRADYTDVIARSVQINAGIWADTLKVSAGANEVNAGHSQTAPIAGSGTTPAFAIDVASLGGMYAGKIALIGTERGVGVRNAGHIGASAGEVVVTADGQLENSGRITGTTGVRIDAGSGIVNSGTVYAQGDTRLTTRGDIDNAGTIAAQSNTTLAATGATSRIDNRAGAALAAGILGDGTLGANGTLRVDATGQLALQGQNLAGGDFAAAAGSLDLSDSQTSARNIDLNATDGGLDASRAAIAASQTLNAHATGTVRTDGASISADRLQLEAQSLSNVGGELLQTGGADLSIHLPGSLDNTGGRIAANSTNLTLVAQALDNTDGRIEHAGTGTLAIDADTLNGTRGAIDSNGALRLDARTATLNAAHTAAKTLQIDTGTLSNQGGEIIQTGYGVTTLRANNRLDNTGGVIVSNGDTTLTAGQLANQGGAIQAAGTANLNLTAGDIDNTAQGQIGAGSALAITAASISNANGQITAGDTLRVQSAGTIRNAAGTIAANRDVMIGADAIDNAVGRIGSVHGDATLTADTGTIDNTGGRIEAAQTLATSGNGLVNANGVISGQDLRLDSGEQLFENSRGTVAARGTLDVQSGELTNDAGVISATGTLAIDTHGQALVNTNSGGTGGILGQSSVTLRAVNLDNASGFVGARGALSADASHIGNTSGGQLVSEQTLALNATTVDNQGGSIQALGTVDIDADTIDNTASLIRSGEALAIDAGTVINTGTQGDNQGIEGQSLALRADRIDNRSGALRADTELNITGAGSLDNTQGLISSGQRLSVQDHDLASKSQVIVNTGGTLIAGQNLSVDSASLSGDGQVLSQGDLSVRLATDFAHSGTIQANGDASLFTTGDLTNQALMQAGGTLQVSATNIDNQASGEISAATTRVHASDTLTNRGLIDGSETVVTADTVKNLGTGRIYGDHLAIGATTLSNDVEGGSAAVIAARQRLDIGAQTVTNREHALIFSADDMAIGGALDEANRAAGSAITVNNHSATIEALGDLTLAAKRVNNTDEHFSTTLAQVGGPEHIVEYQGATSPNRYKPGDPGVFTFDFESLHLMTPEGPYESWYLYDYNRTITATQIASSDPGKIVAGGSMTIDADKVFNDKGHIIAGGTIGGSVGDLENTTVAGTQSITDSGTVTSLWRQQQKGRDTTGMLTLAYTPPAVIQEITLAPTIHRENTAPPTSGTQIDALDTGTVSQQATGAGTAAVDVGAGRIVTPRIEVSAIQGAAGGGPATVIRTGGIDTTLPDNSLFRLNPNPGSGYLIETDPRFANYRNWLSSDYMLSQLSLDPANLHKRLGDGFYEQKLIREQVAELTGRRFLDGFASDEEQFRALIDAGVTFARQWDLVPGVTLTAAQMAQLTSDIVWLIEQTVRLPDGSEQQVLVPQVYVRVKEGDIDGSGALLSAGRIDLQLRGDMTNSGTIAGREVLSISAENIRNLGGRISGGDVAVHARTDLDNLGGLIDASNNLTATAGRDLNVVSTTRSNSNAQGSVTALSRVAGLYVTNPGGGTLVAAAGRDFTLAGAQVGNAASDGQTVLAAGRDLNLTTVDTARDQNLVFDAKNRRSDSLRQEVGSSVQTAGDLHLSAGNDLNARGASVGSDAGAIVATAGRDIRLDAAQTTVSVDEAHQRTGRSSSLSKKTITTEDHLRETTRQGTTFSGDTVALQAGRDITVSGSNVVSTRGTALLAERDVTIAAAQGASDERHLRDEKKSGLFGTGGVGFTWGTQQQSQDNRLERTTAHASTVGSTEGNVTIVAGNQYRQVGSDVLAPQGDIDILARKVDIVEARETSVATQETKFKQSGLTVAVTAPVISAIQTAEQMRTASSQTSDARMQALAVGTTALAARNTADAIAADPKTGGGLNIAITVGGSRSESRTVEEANLARGSTVAAGGTVNIQAKGAGADSDITVRGSRIDAGQDVNLKAEGDIALLAAQNTQEMQRESSSASGGVGVAISVGSGGVGFGVTASASASRGEGEGQDVAWTNTHVNAGNKLTLESGGDTTLRGAVASGEQVVADVGGNLAIESLQDTSRFKSKDRSIGGSVTVGVGFSAGINVGQQKIDSDYASVSEQSGLRAGDGGFQVDVKGNTDLKGGAITSTQQAIDEDRNRFDTGGTLTLSDIHNHAEYSGSAMGASVGSALSTDGKLAVGGPSAGVGEMSDSASSVTRAGISGVAGNTQARTGDAETGLRPIFDAEKVQKEIQAQVQITQQFGQQAGQAVSTYVNERRETMQEQLKEAKTDEERKQIQQQINELNTEERVMNVLIGVVTGQTTVATAQAVLSEAADRMRQAMIEDSAKFAGITDGATELTNLSGESVGVRGDGKKIGGTRIDLDKLCGADNSRCKTNPDGSLALEQGKVQFDPEAAGMSLAAFLETPEGKDAAGATGGIQGAKGTLFGIPYEPGSWQDKLIEAFSGTHDYVGGKVSGLYDEQGNATRGRNTTEKFVHETWSSSGAIVASTPFAMAELLSPQTWNAISILLSIAK